MGDDVATSGSPVQSSITVSTFMLDRYEVTVARFRRYVASSGSSTGFMAGGSCNWSAEPGAREGHPMNCVDWQTAMNFCRWDSLGGTLPSESQWEYAARGPLNRPWPWGGMASDRPDGRICGGPRSSICLEEDPSFAGGATPSPESVWHLVGNVWEWTVDYFAGYSDMRCWGGAARTDPVCMNSASGDRSIRGGSWSYLVPSDLRSGARNSLEPARRNDDVGFRCAGTLR